MANYHTHQTPECQDQSLYTLTPLNAPGNSTTTDNSNPNNPNPNRGPGGVPCYFNSADAPPCITELHNCFTTYIGELISQLDRVFLQMRENHEELRMLNQQTTRLQIKTAQIHNSSCQDGSRVGYHVVPFWDGSCPVRFHDLNRVRNLTDDEVSTYCHGYGMNIEGLDKEHWRSQIAKFIGCRDPRSFGLGV